MKKIIEKLGKKHLGMTAFIATDGYVYIDKNATLISTQDPTSGIGILQEINKQFIYLFFPPTTYCRYKKKYTRIINKE